MAKDYPKSFECPLCKLNRPMSEGRPPELVHRPVRDLIKKEHPDWGPENIICYSCLRKYRMEYVEDTLEAQKGQLTALEDDVLDSLKDQEILSRNINPEFEQELTFGEHLADKVADFGGSWRFIIIFVVFMAIWISVNTAVLLGRPFDPYPYILLNLILSCLAAVQAPIIMMSQNRLEAKDRLRSEHDYQVNLKAEIEIRQLHIKIDQLLNHSWSRLLEIQQIQIDMMEELAEKRGRRS